MDEREARRSAYAWTIPDTLLHSEAMRRACAVRDFQEIFRLVNRRTGASYADIAAAVGKMTSARVSDIIRGVRGIRGEGVIARVADGFGIPGRMLGLPQRSWEVVSEEHEQRDRSSARGGGREEAGRSTESRLPESARDSTGRGFGDTDGFDEMIRREFLRLMSTAGALVSVPATGARGFDGHEPLGPAAVAETFDAMNAHLWQVFALAPSKQALHPVVRDQVSALVSKLAGSISPAEHRKLCAAAGNLFQIAGEIFFDANRYSDAAQCYSLAASAGKEAEAYDLWACALTRHAFVAMAERRFSGALPLLDAAQRIAQRGDGQLSTRYWVSAVQAEAFAHMGDIESCQRSLDRTEQVRSLTGQVHNGGWLRFDGSRLAEERGTCFVALNRPDPAESALTNALRQPLSARRRGSVLIDLAVLGIQRRDIDQVLEHAQAAVDLGQQTGSGYVARKLDGLTGKLGPWASDTRVSHLNERIAALR